MINTMICFVCESLEMWNPDISRKLFLSLQLLNLILSFDFAILEKRQGYEEKQNREMEHEASDFYDKIA